MLKRASITFEQYYPEPAQVHVQVVANALRKEPVQKERKS
jgi:hypothetical protein